MIITFKDQFECRKGQEMLFSVGGEGLELCLKFGRKSQEFAREAVRHLFKFQEGEKPRMPSNAMAKRRGKNKGRQVEEEVVSARGWLSAEEEHRSRLPLSVEGGKLYTLKAQGVIVHYFCMWFICNLHQLGGDFEGWLGLRGGR